MQVIKIGLVLSVLHLPFASYAEVRVVPNIHVMKKGDTLWSLSKRYFNNPLIWIKITELDGSPVKDVYNIPIGHKVLIKPIPVKAKKTLEVKKPLAEKNTPPLVIKKENITENIQTERYVYIDRDTPLIRAFYKGSYVLISFPDFVTYLKKELPRFDDSALYQGVYIDKKLINKLLGI